MLSVAVVCAACEPELGPGRFDAQVLPDTVSGGDVGLAGDVSATQGKTWAMATDWSTCVALGDLRLELRTRKLLKVEVAPFAGFWRETRTVCAVQNTPLLGQATVFPQKLIASLPAMTVHSAHGADGSYASDLETQLFGAHLDHPASDPLPADTSDPRVYDSDGDGHPGGTLQVGGLCELYQVNRAVSACTGKTVAPGRIEGGAVHHVSQFNLGGTSAFCTQAYETTDLQPENRFVLMQAGALDLDGDGQVSCFEIVQSQPQWVTWRDADNARCEAK
jgi:hypothetical protein